MKRITVLGAGLVGSLIARELAADGRYEVAAVDRSADALGSLAGRPRLQTERADLSRPEEIARAVSSADAVVGAVPGFLGHAMLRTVLEAKKPIADISFAPEDPFRLEELARRAGVTAVVDCGVSPGLSSLAAGRAQALLDETESIRIYVGGLPTRRVLPYEYRIVFSATDVLEEYTRPARLMRDGALVTRPALSEVETIDFPVVGTLEAFLTDGLRTVLTTVRARNLEEKTLRYPGHAEKMRLLRETGFLRDTPLDLGDGVRVSPRAVAERLLFEAWRMPPGEEEFTLLKVVAEGKSGGKWSRHTFDLFDRTDRATGATSMARTTGFPCALVARLLADRELAMPGIQPLEFLGRSRDLYATLRAGLSDRGVNLLERVEEISVS